MGPQQLQMPASLAPTRMSPTMGCPQPGSATPWGQGSAGRDGCATQSFATILKSHLICRGGSVPGDAVGWGVLTSSA